jgi:two-component system sensor histidine kinase KdpD
MKLATVMLCGCSVAGVFVCTWLAYHFRLNVASSGFVYLVVVVLTAVYEGFWEATVTSIVAVTCLNYFFIPPTFSFSVADPQNWVALAAFEFTALVVSRLSHRAQVRAAEAVAEHRDADRLYQASRDILLHGTSREPGSFIPPLIREVFGLSGVLLFDADSASAYASGSTPADADHRVRHAYYANCDVFDPNLSTWFCALRLGARPMGGLALCGSNLRPLVATAIASLSAIALERARSLEREFRAEAARQSEQLRAAVLDALGHEFKTPLSVIRTSSSGLLAVGGLSETQTELVSLIDEQAKELNARASRLLTAARLDTTDFKPQREPLLFSSEVKAAIRAFEQPQGRKRFRIQVPSGETPVLADSKLIRSALGQLVDNAIKYSTPGSLIDVGVETRDAEALLTMRSRGLVIAPADRERIFERFYRAPEAQRGSAGTGLGLSIVKRIVEAHHGRVWVESDADHGTVFSLALPTALETPP